MMQTLSGEERKKHMWATENCFLEIKLKLTRYYIRAKMDINKPKKTPSLVVISVDRSCQSMQI